MNQLFFFSFLIPGFGLYRHVYSRAEQDLTLLYFKGEKMELH